MSEDMISMENSSEERMHDCVSREDYESDIHYFIAVDYNIEFDNLIDEYPFILDPDQYWEKIPDDTKERYELFKISTAQYYFLEYRKEYLNFTMDKDNLSIVKGYKSEIEKITDKPELNKGHSDYHILFLSAVRFINGLSGMIGNFKLEDYSKQQIDTFIYLLHSEEYFNLFPLNYDAFDIDKPDNRYRLIGENFGRYFLFAEFLEQIHAELTENRMNSDKNAAIKNNAIDRKVNEDENVNIFSLVQHDYLDKFKELLSKLSESDPLAALTTNLSKKNREELLRDKELYIYRKQIVYTQTENEIYIGKTINAPSFLAYLVAYMCKHGWIDYEPNSKTKEKTQVYISKAANRFLYFHSSKEPVKCHRPQLTDYLNLVDRAKTAPENHYTKFMNVIFCNL